MMKLIRLCMSKSIVKQVNLFLVILGLQSCQVIDVVTAQSQPMKFRIVGEEKYAAEFLPDEAISQIKREIFDPNSEWIGDPRRFSVRKIQQMGQTQPLYYITPMIECPETGCNMFYHLPLCGATGGCTYVGYIEEKGKYRQVFNKLFWLQGKGTPRVSEPNFEGVPACFEIPGYDFESREKGLPELSEQEIFMSRYCYNGQEYILNKLYLVPIEKGIN